MRLLLCGRDIRGLSSGALPTDLSLGSLTAGLIPEALRGTREKELLSASDFAQKIGVKQIATHVGFLPENYFDKDFRGTVAVLCRICKVMKARQQVFLFKSQVRKLPLP